MTEPSPTEHHHAHVVVHPVVAASPPYRRVDILGESVGKAYGLEDVAEFCRRAGLEELDLDSERMVEWIGGGSDVWEQCGVKGAGFESKAEYEWHMVLLWHVVDATTATALCGRWLAPTAEARPIGDIEAMAAEDVCVRCFAMWSGGVA